MSGSFPVGEERAKKTPLEALLLAHRVAAGEHVVLLWRRFDPGSIYAVDDERYEQLTLEVPTVEPGLRIDLRKGENRAFYSAGSAAFARKGYGRYSISTEGFVLIEQVASDSVTATVDAKFLTESASPFGGEPQMVTKAGRFVFHRAELSRLTPWQGKEVEALERAAYK
jgi:hypothetical protein